MYYTGFLYEQGNPSNVNFIGDYSTTPLIAEVRANAGEILILNALHILIRDAGTFNADDYASITNGLTNGIVYRLSDDNGIIHNMCPFGGIKTNAQYTLLAMKVESIQWGSGDNFLSVYCNFLDSGQPIILSGSQRFEAVFNDNLTDLVSNQYYFKGQMGSDTAKHRNIINNQYMIDLDEYA
jgi:hypothetical protein